MNKKNIVITVISVLILTCMFAFARTTTTDLGLVKPVWTENIDILDDINANSDILEAFANAPLLYDTEERVEDRVGAMLGGTETLITVTYDDAGNAINFIVNNDLSLYSNATSAFITNTELAAFTGSTNIVTLGTIGTGTWNATAIADGKIVSALTGKTYNALTLTAAATGFTIAGGTTSKTLTLNDNFNVSTQLSAISANTSKVTESTTVTAPLVKTTYDISIPAASTSVSGYLSSTNWNTFNSKAASGANSDITSLTGLTTPLASTYGGTGNGFTKFSGPATSEKTFTLPNENATLARTDAAQSFTGVQTMTSPALTTPAITGISTGTGVATAASVNTLALRDASGNISTVNLLKGYTTTATAAGTTTLVVGSTHLQYFTGTTTQIVKMPVTSTLVLGQQYLIVNNSTGLVTVNSSGDNAIIIINGNTSVLLTCTLITGTTAASWSASYQGIAIATGKKLNVSNTLTLAGTDGTTMTFPSASGNVAVTANKLSAFAATTSAELAGVISDETGTGILVFGTSPTFTTGITTPLVNTIKFGLGAGSVATNVAIGTANTLTSNTTGNNNFAFGDYTLYSNTEGTYNVGLGVATLVQNTTGSFNCTMGNAALYENTTGSYNTVLGTNAARYQANGSTYLVTPENSVYIGANVRGFNDADDNTIVIGYNAIGKGANKITMGNTSITHAHVQVAWTVDSDIRDKTNITPLLHGLDFINALNPISFQFITRREEETIKDHEGKKVKTLLPDNTSWGRERYGFSAQDILAEELKYGDKSIIIDNSDPEHLGYNPTEMIPILVNAVQELSAKIEELEARIVKLEKK